MKVLVTLKMHEGSILHCTVTNTSPLGRKWIERHLGSTLFLICFFLSVPRWTIVSRKTSVVPAGASTQPLQSVFILLFTKNVRGFCFAFIFFCSKSRAGSHLPFVLGSWKMSHVVKASVWIDIHGHACENVLGGFMRHVGMWATSQTKILVTSSDAVLLGWLVQGGVTGYSLPFY